MVKHSVWFIRTLFTAWRYIAPYEWYRENIFFFLILTLLHFLCFLTYSLFSICASDFLLIVWWWNSCIFLGVISLLLKCFYLWYIYVYELFFCLLARNMPKNVYGRYRLFIFKCVAAKKLCGSLYYVIGCLNNKFGVNFGFFFAVLLRSSYPLCCMVVTENGFGEMGVFFVNCSAEVDFVFRLLCIICIYSTFLVPW